jgi:S-disulfanyl-L-cysteine oxidoreductase SoxD
MSTHRRVAAAAAVVLLASCAGQRTTPPATGPALGQAVDAAEIAGYDISIPPSGAGLPRGSGNARAGAAVYEQKCQACHGAKGAGKPADALAGGIGSLGTKTPMRTVGSYWPYATTLFDYVRRAMPITNPLSLTDEETYAVTAYVLYLNGIVGEDVAMDAQSLPQVKMPNRDGFIAEWPLK